MALELTSVANVQSYLQDSSADSTLLTTLATGAEAVIARYCGRYDQAGGVHWGSASRTERIDGNLSQHILLTFAPITDVASVSITTSASQTISVNLTDLECDGIAIASLGSGTPGVVGRLGYRLSLPAPVSAWFDTGLPQPSPFAWPSSPNFGGNRNGVVVAYTGGYASIPGDLSLAATMLTAQLFNDSGRNPSVVSERLGEFQQQFADPTKAELILGPIAGMLAGYRRYIV